MTRRTLTLALAVAAVAFTAGCGAGQRTQTDQKVPSVPGANMQVTVSPGPGSVSVRNAFVSYPGPAGYEVGQSASIEVRIFNNTTAAVRLVGVTSDSGTVAVSGGSGGAGGWVAPAPTPSAAASASPAKSAAPSPSPSPSAVAAVDVEIAAAGFVILAPGEAQSLRLTGLKRALRVGDSVRLAFRFDSDDPKTTIPQLDILVPVAPPEEPAPRSPMVFEPGEEGGHG